MWDHVGVMAIKGICIGRVDQMAYMVEKGVSTHDANGPQMGSKGVPKGGPQIWRGSPKWEVLSSEDSMPWHKVLPCCNVYLIPPYRTRGV